MEGGLDAVGERMTEKVRKKEGENASTGIKRTATSGGIRLDILIMEARPGKGVKPSLHLTDEGADYIAKLAGLGCNEAEVASDLGVHINTLNNSNNRIKFKAAMERGRQTFTKSIRVNQMSIMRRGSASMAIFLGKNYLGQSDRTQVNISEVPMESFVSTINRFRAKDGDKSDGGNDSKDGE